MYQRDCIELGLPEKDEKSIALLDTILEDPEKESKKEKITRGVIAVATIPSSIYMMLLSKKILEKGFNCSIEVSWTLSGIGIIPLTLIFCEGVSRTIMKLAKLMKKKKSNFQKPKTILCYQHPALKGTIAVVSTLLSLLSATALSYYAHITYLNNLYSEESPIKDPDAQLALTLTLDVFTFLARFVYVSSLINASISNIIVSTHRLKVTCSKDNTKGKLIKDIESAIAHCNTSSWNQARHYSHFKEGAGSSLLKIRTLFQEMQENKKTCSEGCYDALQKLFLFTSFVISFGGIFFMLPLSQKTYYQLFNSNNLNISSNVMPAFNASHCGPNNGGLWTISVLSAISFWPLLYTAVASTSGNLSNLIFRGVNHCKELSPRKKDILIPKDHDYKTDSGCWHKLLYIGLMLIGLTAVAISTLPRLDANEENKFGCFPDSLNDTIDALTITCFFILDLWPIVTLIGKAVLGAPAHDKVTAPLIRLKHSVLNMNQKSARSLREQLTLDSHNTYEALEY